MILKIDRARSLSVTEVLDKASPFLVIEGERQTGKTSLIQALLGTIDSLDTVIVLNANRGLSDHFCLRLAQDPHNILCTYLSPTYPYNGNMLGRNAKILIIDNIDVFSIDQLTSISQVAMRCEKVLMTTSTEFHNIIGINDVFDLSYFKNNYDLNSIKKLKFLI